MLFLFFTQTHKLRRRERHLTTNRKTKVQLISYIQSTTETRNIYIGNILLFGYATSEEEEEDDVATQYRPRRYDAIH